ncbi:MAG TPA: hypothetical protein VF453_09490 [Burkholderiaceae bacterium]
MFRFLAIGIALGLTACASHTEVMALGGDKYMVGYQQRGGLNSWTEVKFEAVKLANAHCAGMNKTAEVLNAEETGARGWTPMNVEVTFTCH